MLKKLYHLYFVLRRPMTLGVRAVVEDAQGRILLVRHTYIKGWYFPGGGVETGQTMLQALERELSEEVYIEDAGACELYGIYFNRHASNRDHVGVYLCKGWGQQKAFEANSEIAEVGFFHRDELPQDTTKGTRRRLAEIYDGVAVSQEW